MKNIIKSIKNSTICLFVVCLAGCAGMTDADWEALGAAAEAIADATPSKSKSSAYRSSSSSSSSYSSNSQSSPSSSSGSSSSDSSIKRYVNHVTKECIEAEMLPRKPSDFQQWVSLRNKCNFTVNVYLDAGNQIGKWTRPGENISLTAYRTDRRAFFINMQHRSSFRHIGCAITVINYSGFFDTESARCYDYPQYK